MAWTQERLREVIRDRLAGMKLVVVANREPYIHVRDGEEVKCMIPASGLTTALDPVMRVCHGVWVAHGSGDADREVSDEKGRIQVPPDDPSYTLRRVWLSKEQEQGYYYGFSNETLWPLCHIAYQRPKFDTSDWEQYRQVNRLFADTILEEVDDGPAIVLIQAKEFVAARTDGRGVLVLSRFTGAGRELTEAIQINPYTVDEFAEALYKALTMPELLFLKVVAWREDSWRRFRREAPV